MSDPLKIFPADVRTSASDFRKMGEQARQIQDTLTRAWARLDTGWEDYAESGIQSHYSEAMNELSLMIAMFEQMDQALVQSADGIEAADKSATALFTDQSSSQSGSGKPPGHAKMMFVDDPVDTANKIIELLSYSFFRWDWSVDGTDQAEILRLLNSTSDLSAVIQEINRRGMLVGRLA